MPSRKKKTRKTKPTIPRLPFAFRYEKKKTKKTLQIINRVGGFVIKPISDRSLSSGLNLSPQIALAFGRRYKDMPTGVKRAISQVDVMGGLSPNKAASALDLEKPFFPNWEWLHLVAYSISPTHIPKLSTTSRRLIRSTDQVQQIRENLVLGSAAANTEMLTWETLIKNATKNDPRLTVSLFCSATVSHEEVTIGRTTYQLSLCHRIQYHFQFINQRHGKVSVPFIIEIDPQSHSRPSSMSFEEATTLINEALTTIVEFDDDHMPRGMKVKSFHEL
jgi:hypothetical protein